ncbi:uncharacterized protein SPPG_03175 [Spizellomyces punctatus DAOM BR117]|uniref:Uncharacterized protein n=1 Tax=Spizellomyces punctatus (strain DAOM BR117) TaxID=645134 RepID=A0A0L0HJR2_SPIPD|nr:uncharacterized protein SPPG_03175 [Spizellomyces punctatus DAOM BR117]KND01362.1 hypothetical protein SPPG_03175 [Spizellomyces punctatus DAOM BR117]|eukprot:XP_016609401.1 hypothetical protein SPPG_03175 [Spizellomyces punctatus DAOM BR117]
MIASESEDEAFDDIEFPDSVEALRLGAYRHTGQSSEVEMDGEDDADDPSAGLVIPDDGTLHPGRLKVTPIAGPTPSPRAASPSKIPRLVPSAFVSSYVQADMHGKPKPLTGTYISGPDRRTGPSAPISPSLGHIQRLSSQLISQRKLHGDSPTKLIRKPKGAQQYGDGTELDTFDDLPVSSTTENKFVKTIKVTPKINPAKPVHNTSLKRSSSKAGSMGSIVSSPEERENRRPYTAGGPVHHRPSQTYQDRRPPTSHKRRPRKKPTLIRNLNNSNAVKVVGDMVYNPALQKWEGNEDVLAEFDKALPSRPALITNKGGYKMPQVVGNMVFDPIKMCWVGNDEEADVFADISDDMSVVTEMGSGGFVPEQTEFNLSKSFKEAMCIAESSHKLFMGKWYPKAVLDSRTMMRDTSKTHLYEIRSHTNGDRRPKLMGRHAIWR